MHYKLEFSYIGTNYFGYAKQPNKLTIQGIIEDLLTNLFSDKIIIHASGRTDKGVHALIQVADFYSDKIINTRNIVSYLNNNLNNDIKILNCEIVDDKFSSRFSVKSKTYAYLISDKKVNIFLSQYVYVNELLDINKIQNAIKLFKGSHNFQNFTSKKEDEWNFIRTIYNVKVKKDKDYFELIFKGNGFMKYMVRKMVGTLIEIGIGKIDESFIQEQFNSNKRNIVNYTAPSFALFLKEIRY